MKKQSKHSKNTSHNVGRRYASSETTIKHKPSRFKNEKKHRVNRAAISNLSNHRMNKRKTSTKFTNNRNSNNVKKLNIKTILVFIIIILVVIFGIMEINQLVTTNNNNKDTSTYSTKIKESKKIDGLNNIQVEELNIKSNDNLSTVELKLKNNSNENQEAFKSNLCILNKDNALLFETQCFIKDIPANSESTYSVTTSNEDLSNTKTYTIKKIE